ncbi:hypothetical protein MANES_04G128800v8 [Manihot esculenta]|uniref:Uncharacterized protein n=1 Tax=Manihot esculenta TaxID=3983 RepID=A0ACB7HUS2_MANES|nr:hypothetical protein MANES_04G128800v8 [Manihot esculenta]
MAGFGSPWSGLSLRSAGAICIFFLGVASMIVVAEARLKQEVLRDNENEEVETGCFTRSFNFLWQKGQLGYTHVWPEMKFGWQIVVGSIIGFFGAAFGSVGGVGGGGIFVPMLTLIIGFDAKSSTAISKCMITGAAASTVYYNLKLRHPTLDLPIIDYDLALLFQPMLVLGISIGVVFNVIFADWMITVLLIILFFATSTKAFFKGVETWKKETIIKKEAARRLAAYEVEYKSLPGGPRNGAGPESKDYGREEIPVAVGVSSCQAVSLYRGQRKIASNGEAGTNWKVHQLVLYCCCGVLAGMVGGLLGLGGGFILGPLFLELGVPPQVSSATATFAMTFSASMSVIEYYLLKRFPVPYALYFVAVTTVAALVGQHVVRKLISVFGRASIIIFILSFTIFVSAISLGGVGIGNLLVRIGNQEYMGFENICAYKV